MSMRLQKYLAACGVASRRESESLIEKGRVTVNGTVAQVGDSVAPDGDDVVVDGQRVEMATKVYVVLNKPRGVVTTVKDTHARKTVADCLDGVRARVFPVGRLDMDVEGVLLLTNDGELAHRLMHPKFEIAKLYIAWVKGRMATETAAHLAGGIELDDGPTAPCRVNVLEAQAGATLVRIEIHEGRKREVKRMCAAVGHPVTSLRRVEIGGVRVNGLRPGEWRYLGDDEVASLRALTGL